MPAWDSLDLALAAAHFWSDTVPEGPGGLDGSRWIPEGVRTDRRLLVDHWSPQEVGPDAAFRRAGKTIIFVSHALEAVRSLCNRAIWLDDGVIKMDGEVNEVVDAYEAKYER